MDCKKADDYMMKYMDRNLSEDEALKLKEHIDNCDQCKEDFFLYDAILSELSNAENIISAPIDFEINVMARINQLPNLYAGFDERNEFLLCKLWGIISVIAGIGTIFIINKETIASFISTNAYFKNYEQMFLTVEQYVTSFKMSFEEVVSSILNALSIYAINLRYVSLIVFILLIVAQYLIYKKDKVEA